MIQLGVFDLDGTLLNNEGRLPESFDRDVSELSRRGVHVAIASARPAQFLFEMFHEDVDLLISGEDGNIFFRGRQLLNARFIGYELIDKVRKITENRADLAILLSGLSDLYVSEEDYDRFVSWGLKRFMPDEPKNLTGTEKICKIHLFCRGGVEEAKKMIATTLSILSLDYDLQEAGYGWIGIMEKNSNKATAVRFFQDYLGLSRDEIAVFGDSSNDVPMFEMTRYSFAMKNAPADIRQKASYVTEKDNCHNGAMETLLKITSPDYL